MTDSNFITLVGFKVENASTELGVASAIKMCRSVIVKGMEAIVIESFVAARKYGVEDQVLASLAETFPGLDWEKNASYFFQRVIQHGRRRAAEMREAAVTVREAGLEPLMAAAIAARQAWVADLADAGAVTRGREGAGWREHADAIAHAEQGAPKRSTEKRSATSPFARTQRCGSPSSSSHASPASHPFSIAMVVALPATRQLGACTVTDRKDAPSGRCGDRARGNAARHPPR